MKYLKIFTDFRDVLDPLTDQEAGRLFRAMLQYAQNGTESELPGNEKYLWMVAKQHMDREAEAYEAKREALRESGKKGAAARWGHPEEQDGKCHQEHGVNSQDKDKDNDNDKDNEREHISPQGGMLSLFFFLPWGEGERKKTAPFLERNFPLSEDNFHTSVTI